MFKKKNKNNKNKTAFTLIELLAIIVILAIIAVITVPIILNIIENAKKGAAIDSAYGYKDAVYKSFLAELSDDTTKVLPEGTYSLNNTGKLVRNNPLSELNVNVSGTTPSDGWMEFTKGEAKAYSLRFGDYVVTKYSDTKAEAVKNGEIAENAVDRENRLETERQMNAITTAKNAILSETGTTEIRDITDGWVAFIDGSLKAYSIRVTEGEYTYIVTDLDVNSDNSNADASRVTTDLASKTSTEQLIINYYSDQVATEVGTYIASLATETQGFTKDEGKKVSELTTAVPTGMDVDSWIFYDNTSSSITDYSIKMTKGGYVFVVNCTAGTVSDPVYNGTITTPQ